MRKARQVSNLDRQGISAQFLCVRNNKKKISVIYNNKHLFLVHVSATHLGRFASAVYIRFSQGSCFRLWIQLSLVTKGVQFSSMCLHLGTQIKEQQMSRGSSSHNDL